MKLTTKQAAEYLGLSYYYLRNMRHGLHNFEGPRFTFDKHPRGLACYYLLEDLKNWKAQHPFRKKI